MTWLTLILCIVNMILTYFVTLRVIARVEKIEYLIKKFDKKENDEDVPA